VADVGAWEKEQGGSDVITKQSKGVNSSFWVPQPNGTSS